MPDLQFGYSSYVRERGDFPFLPVVNMFAEETPTEGKVSLISRPGLEYTSQGFNPLPVNTIYQEDGVLNGQYFSIVGSNIYNDTTNIGGIDGFGVASIAGYQNTVFFNRGDSIFAFDGASLYGLPFPDDAEVLKITVASSRLICIRRDTQKFYWSDVLSTNIDGLSFASAENSPDRLLDFVFLGDKLYLFGSSSVEVWPVTTDPDLPFKPLQGATFQTGIKNTGAVVALASSSFAWVTSDDKICVGTPETVVSFPGLETKISKESNVLLWSFHLDGEEFLVADLSEETWVFKLSSQTWSTFQTYGYPKWIASSYAKGRFGSNIDGSFLEWSNDYSETGVDLERIFRAWTPITTDGLSIDNLILRTSTGHTPFLTGTFLDPIVEIRTSRDGGNKWTDWRSRHLGENGEYRHQVYWNGLGYFSFPGCMIEFRVSDPVPFRASTVVINEPIGGS